VALHRGRVVSSVHGPLAGQSEEAWHAHACGARDEARAWQGSAGGRHVEPTMTRMRIDDDGGEDDTTMMAAV
jgi:hypothetical protein